MTALKTLAVLLCLGAQDAAPDVKEIADRALKSVVVITFTGRNGEQQGLGSGFVISKDGLIATNLHVIGEARPIKVQFADGKTFKVTSVHATEKAVDLAILRIDAHDLPALPLANERLPQGAPVVAIGNPRGLRHSVVTGVVSARREVDGHRMIQLAIPVEQGNSGGPVLDHQGRVHGILTMKSTVTDNLGFAMEIQALQPLLKKPNPVPMSRWLTIGQLDKSEWSTLYGARWRQRAGRLSVEGAGTGFGGRALCFAARKAPEPPYELAVSVRLEHDDGAAGLIFGADGGDHHYGFYPTSGSMRLTRFEGPTVFTWTILSTVASPHYRPGDWNRLKVRIEKQKILCYVNGKLVIESDDTEYRTSKVGLAKFRHTHADFRDFRAAKKIAPAGPPADALARLAALVDSLPAEKDVPAESLEKLLQEPKGAPEALRKKARALEAQAERLRALARTVHVKRVQASLAEQLSVKDAEVDLLHAALLLARLDNEEVDVPAYRSEIDRLAATVKRSLPENASESDRLAVLDRTFFKELLFHGSRTDYYNRSNSYLNEVIDDREGLPISLSVLYMELGRRVGVRIVGIPLPGRFVVRFIPSKGKGTLIDVFDGGKRLTRDEAKEIIRGWSDRALTDDELEDLAKQFLKPADARQIVTRMLINLIGSAPDAGARLRYAETVLAFDPDDASMRAERLQVNMAAGRYRAVLPDVEWFLENRPPGLDADRIMQLRRQILQRLERENP